jgi:hypothetical protein
MEQEQKILVCAHCKNPPTEEMSHDGRHMLKCDRRECKKQANRRWHPRRSTAIRYWNSRQIAYAAKAPAENIPEDITKMTPAEARKALAKLRRILSETLDILDHTRGTLFLLVENKHGPKVASEYPEVVKAVKHIQSVKEEYKI